MISIFCIFCEVPRVGSIPNLSYSYSRAPIGGGKGGGIGGLRGYIPPNLGKQYIF